MNDQRNLGRVNLLARCFPAGEGRGRRRWPLSHGVASARAGSRPRAPLTTLSSTLRAREGCPRGRRSGESLPRVWPGRRLFFLTPAVAAQPCGRVGSSGLSTARVGLTGLCLLWLSGAREQLFFHLPL